MTYLPPLNGGRLNASISGNTAGVKTLVSTGNLILAGGNNVTLSQNANSITISGANNPVFSAGMSNIGNTSGTSGTASNQLIFAGGNNITLSQVTGAGGNTLSFSAPAVSSLSATGAVSISVNGGTVSIGAPNQSVQTQNMVSIMGSTGNISFADGNGVSFGTNGSTISASVATTYAASNHSHGSPTLNLTNLSGTTASASNGLTLSLAAAAQTNQSLSFFASGANTFSTTSTGRDARSVHMSGMGGISLGYSTDGVLRISAPTTYAASNHSHGSPTLNLTNLSGTTASASNGLTLSLAAAAQTSVSFANSNGIGFGLNAGTLTASHNGITSQTNQTIGFSAIGNTTGSTSATNLDARTINLSGAGNVSVGYSGNSVIISGAGGAGGGVALYDGVNSISSGTARISGSGALTASVNGQTLNLSVPATSSIVGQGAVTIGTAGNTINIGAPTQTNQALGASNGSFTFQTASFGSANGVTFGTSAGSVITASVNTSYAASNHTHGSPTLNLTNLSGTTASASNGLTLSLAAPAMFDAGVSNTIAGGSTYGTMATSLTGGLAFYAGSNIGLSQATAAGGNGSITINAANGGGGGSIGFSAGAASSSLSSVRFADSNGIGFGLNGSVMTASHNGITSQTVQTANLYASGNSTQLSSTAGVDLRSVSFEGAGIASVGVSQGKVLVSVPAGGGGLTNLVVHAGASTNSVSALSFDDANGVSFGLNGSVITASANAGAAAPVSYNYFNPQDAYVQVTGAHGQGTLHMQPSKVPNVQFDRLVFPIFWSNSTNSTASVTMSLWFGVYTRTNGTFSLASSTSMATNWVAAGNASSASLNGVRLLTMGSTNTILEDQYYFAIISRSTAGGGNGTLQQLVASQQNSSFSGIMGTVSNASVQYTRGLGYYSVSTTGLPNSVAMSELRGNSSMALRQPMFYFLNSTY